jgi:hypothetical protein
MLHGLKRDVSMTLKLLQLRLSFELENWIAAPAVLNRSSQNSEIIQSIREWMEASLTFNGSIPYGQAD